MNPAGATICFDMDGTLVDTAPDLVGAMNHVLAQHGFAAVEYDAAKSMIGHGASTMIRSGLTSVGRSVSDGQLVDMEEAFGEYYLDNYATNSTVFSGVKQALDGLQESGFTLAVCSNTGERLVKTILNTFGLLNRFSTVCGGDTTLYKKPDPRSLLHTVETSGGILSKSVMVGDSETDIEAAKRADLPIIAFDFGYSKVPVREMDPTATLSHYSQLRPTMDKLILSKMS